MTPTTLKTPPKPQAKEAPDNENLAFQELIACRHEVNSLCRYSADAPGLKDQAAVTLQRLLGIKQDELTTDQVAHLHYLEDKLVSHFRL